MKTQRSLGDCGGVRGPVSDGALRRALALLLGTALVAAFTVVADRRAGAEEQAVAAARAIGKAFTAVAREASPAVVFIQVEKSIAQGPEANGRGLDDFFNDDLLRRFFGDRLPIPRPPRGGNRISGQGSGFIISKDGYIHTTNHVVGGADRITVKTTDGRELRGKLIGTDPHSDVAVIKVEAKGDLPVLPLGDSDALEVGEWVLALGNPFGLSNTLTAGIVSAKGRSAVGITDYEDFIQTDAAINPGNSGGPLLNLDGKVVGINTAIFSRSGGYMGIGFAIPINMAKRIRDQLMKTGSVTRGYLGVLIQPLTPALAETFGVKDAKGILVAEVTSGSPAEKAGLKRGDVIVKADGEPVADIGHFRNRIALTAPGTKVRLGVLRDGKPVTVTVTLGTLPDSGVAPGGAAPALEKLGISVQALTPELASRFGYEGETGVIVSRVEPGSAAARAGIRSGSLIQEVDRKPVSSVDEFRRALDRALEDGTVVLLVRDRGVSHYIAIKLDGGK